MLHLWRQKKRTELKSCWKWLQLFWCWFEFLVKQYENEQMCVGWRKRVSDHASYSSRSESRWNLSPMMLRPCHIKMSHLSLVIPSNVFSFSLCQTCGWNTECYFFCFGFVLPEFVRLTANTLHNSQRSQVTLKSLRAASTLPILIVLHSFGWAGSQTPCLLAPPAGRRGHPPHLLECGSVANLPLRAYGCLSRRSPAFARLFNLTVPLPAGDKMEKPCGGGLSQVCTHSQEYRISPQIPPVHFRYDPINVRILCLCLLRACCHVDTR